MPSFRDSTLIVFLHPPSPFCFLSVLGHIWVGSHSSGWHSSLLTGLATFHSLPQKSFSTQAPEWDSWNTISLQPSSTISCIMLGTPDHLLVLEHPWGLRGLKGSVSGSPPWGLHRAYLLFGISQNLQVSFFFFLAGIFVRAFLHSALNQTILCKFASPAKSLLNIHWVPVTHVAYTKPWRYSWVKKNEAYSTASGTLVAIVFPAVPGTVLCTW